MLVSLYLVVRCLQSVSQQGCKVKLCSWRSFLLINVYVRKWTHVSTAKWTLQTCLSGSQGKKFSQKVMLEDGSPQTVKKKKPFKVPKTDSFQKLDSVWETWLKNTMKEKSFKSYQTFFKTESCWNHQTAEFKCWFTTDDKRSPLQLSQVDPHLCTVTRLPHPNLENKGRDNPSI